MNTSMMFYLLNKRELSYFSKCHLGKLLDTKCNYSNFIRQKSYYQVLGLNSSASAKEIKSAYYKLSLQFHPDRNKGCPDSVAKFHEITEAYEVLNNPDKKRSYDQAGNFKTHYSSFDAQTGYYYKPYAKNRSNRPFSGKTKDFDYDEHFRQHYDYERQRQVEYEYFKRRWEAEYNRRNRNNAEYFRKEYKYYKNENYYSQEKDYSQEREYTYEDISRLRLSIRRRLLFFLFPVWSLLLAIPFLNDLHNPEKIKPYGPLYYTVKTDDDDDDSKKDK